MTAHTLKRRRKLRLESLENRHLLAPVISEVSTGVDSTSPQTNQFFELRGDPNEVLPSGTYLAVVESYRYASAPSAGEITMLFDLSNQSFGQNGYLVLAPLGNPYAINASSNAIVSAGAGFSGMPTGMFTGDPNGGVDTWSVMLFQSSAAPTVGLDIDTNNDGLIDTAGPAGQWQILDSITIGTGHTFFGYGLSVFGNANVMSAMQPASQFISSYPNAYDDFGYMARIFATNGSARETWVGGVALTNDSINGVPRLTHGETFRPVTMPIAFGGKELDHVGGPNFFGSVSGVVRNDDTGQLIPGIQILADENGNGQRDLKTLVIEPDTFAIGQEMTNPYPGITLTGTYSTGEPSYTIEADTPFWYRGNASTGSKVFSTNYGDIDYYHRLRVDFLVPAYEVSIDVIGNYYFSNRSQGQMQAFDSFGNSLGIVRTGLLSQNQVEKLTFTAPNNNIAYVVIMDDSSYGEFDNMVVKQWESQTVSDSQGRYSLGYLNPGTYDILLPNPVGNVLKSPVGGSQEIIVESTDRYHVDFLFGANKPPVIDQTQTAMSVPENSLSGTVIGQIVASDPDTGQSLRYRATGGDGYRVFAVHALTGEVRVVNPRNLNFEQKKSYELEVQVFDNFTEPLSDTATLTIRVENVNEPPVISSASFSLSELAAPGTVLGSLSASDPDELNVVVDPNGGDPGSMLDDPNNESIGVGASVFTFAIDDPAWQNTFAIDPQSGEISVTNPAALDFENASRIVLHVAATDQGFEPKVGRQDVLIDLTNENEAPHLITSELIISETPHPGDVLGVLTATDPDANQMTTMEIIGGTGQGIFALQPQTGELRLADGAQLDFETQTSYDLTIKVTDNGTPPLSTVDNVLQIFISDVDERPEVSIDNGGVWSVDENAPGGTVVGTFSAVDPEGSAIVMRVIKSDPAFVVDQATGTVTVADGATIDYEQATTHTLMLRFQDQSVPSNFVDTPITINVVDLPEPPTVPVQTLLIPENSPSDVVLGTIQVDDPDDDVVSIIATGGTGIGVFSVDPSTGDVRLNSGQSLDYESVDNRFTLEIQATDSMGNSSPIAFVYLNVTDVNERPEVVSTINSVRVGVGQSICVSLNADHFSDPEGQTLDISLGTTFGDFPDWLHFNSLTQQLIGTPTINDTGFTSLSVRATDNGTPPLSVSTAFTIDVTLATDGDTNYSDCVSTWHNASNPYDVNRSNSVSAIDALLILNFLNTRGPQIVPQEEPENMLDVDGNNAISPVDALQVLNYLNRIANGQTSGEYDANAAYDANPLALDQSLDSLSATDIALDGASSSAELHPQLLADLALDLYDSNKKKNRGDEPLIVDESLAIEFE